MIGRLGSELLEREAELRALSALLDAADAGSGQTLVIEGEAGVGKTALLEEACARAAARDMTVLRARGGELEREFQWGVVRQLFEPRLTQLSPAGRSIQLSGSAALAEPVFSRDGATAETGDDSFSTLHGLYWMTVNLARDAPVLLAIDDLHWSDRPSLRYAVHLAPRLDGLSIVLLATIRPIGSEPASDGDLLRRLMADPAGGQLRPAPLSHVACAEVVRRRLSPTADPAFCLACHEMSRGNPFLLGALVDSLRAERAEATAEGVERVRRMTPDAVARSVLVRLATLPRGCQALVRAIAVLGAQAEFRRARLLAGLDTGQATLAAAALTRAGIVRGESILEFVHPLVRSAVYGDLPPAERARWHARAAQLQAGEGAPAEEIAPHLLASFPERDQSTVEQLRRTAALARARGAPELAVAYLSRALAEPPTPSSRAEVLLELGAAEALQQPDDAIAHLREALECAQTGQQRGTISLTLGDTLAASSRLPEAISVLDHGLDEVDGKHHELRDRLEAALIATARWERSAQPRRRKAVTELEGRAAAGERLDPLLNAQLAVEIAAAGTERELAIDHARLVLASAPELTVSATTVPEVALVLAFAGLPKEGWQATQSALGTARRLGWPVGIAAASTCAALIALQLGWISEALASAREAMIAGTEMPLAPVTVAFLTEALIERGETDAAEKQLVALGLDGELELAWPTTPLLLARGKLRAASGDHSGAIEDLRATGERVAAWGLTNPAMTPWRSSVAVSLAAVQARCEAIRLATEELALARRWGAPRAIGIALRALGVAYGDEHGCELLLGAATLLKDAQSPVEYARSQFEVGAALRRHGYRSQARIHLRDCLDVAHRYGAIGLADRARQELVVAGARPRRDALRGRDALTSGELRVARLAADGRTNNEIAQLLFITPRTVETHLTSSYSKLGIHSRRDLPRALQARTG